MRYLQPRDEFTYDEHMMEKYLVEIRKRLADQIPFSLPILAPIDVNVPGRFCNCCNNDRGIIGVSIFNPIHF